jgi:hypothetical protein
MLLAYLEGITHVDPLRYGLSMDRFLTLDRIQSGKLPDVDQDLPHRDLLVSPDPKTPEKGWLVQRFGDCVAQISVDTTMKLKSAARDVARVLTNGNIPSELNSLIFKFEDAPQGIPDRDFVFGYKGNDGPVPGSVETDPALAEYVKRYPKHWAIVQKCLGVVRSRGRHASAYVIADEPLHNFIPTTTVSDVKVTQYTAGSVEAVGGIKMDFLVVNSLNDISACIRMIQERGNGLETKDRTINERRVPPVRQVPHKGEHLDVWDLPEDQAVFRKICEGDTVTVFQFGTPGAIKWLNQFNHIRKTEPDGTVHKALDSIESLAAFTALDRPGPLDAYVEDPETRDRHNMLVEFARRARGERSIGSFPILNELFPETYGVLTYQEQLQKAFQELGGTSGIEANNFRIHVSKKQMKEVFADKEVFMKGAVGRIGTEAAEQLWSSMETFGQYGFNKSVDGDSILPSCEGEKRLRDFRPGDRVWGVDDNGKLIETDVVALHDHGILEGFEVTFEDGATIVASANHKFLTADGMLPLHSIASAQKEVLCVEDEYWKTTQAGRVAGAVRPDVLHQTRVEGSPGSMSHMCFSKEIQHPSENGSAQLQTGAAGSIFHCRTKNICKKGYTASAGGAFTPMAGGESRGIQADRGSRTPQYQTVQDGGMVAEQWHPNVAADANPLRSGSEAGGLCLSRSHDLDRSGRILSFLRAKEYQNPACNRPAEGQHAESGGDIARERNVDPPGRRMLPFLDGRAQAGVARVAYSDAPLTEAGDLVCRKIVRIRSVGPRRMYDLEVAHPKHNFVLKNGVVTSNSHAVCYVVIGYACAWLKYHYPLEWWTAVLRNASKNEIDETFWSHCGHLVDPPDISQSSEHFEIVGTRIRAPLNLLHGLGPKAHQELLAYRPITGLEDLVRKVENFKTTNTKTAENGATRKGTSAINSGVVQKLIISGAMDTLFPPDLDIREKLMLWEKAKATVLGKKQEPIADSLQSISPIERYQLKKEILPSFSEDIRKLISDPRVTGNTLYHDGDSYRIVGGQLLSTLQTGFGGKTVQTVAALGYVVSFEKRTYQGSKEMAKFKIDIDGLTFELIKWPDKTGRLPGHLRGPLEGSIVITILSRYKQGKPFSIDDLVVLSPAIATVTKKSKEESKSEST